jgi:hypothetical protein
MIKKYEKGLMNDYDIIEKLNEIIKVVNELDKRTGGMIVVDGVFKKIEKANPYNTNAILKKMKKPD